jgi:hypothetical protein
MRDKLIVSAFHLFLYLVHGLGENASIVHQPDPVHLSPVLLRSSWINSYQFFTACLYHVLISQKNLHDALIMY